MMKLMGRQSMTIHTVVLVIHVLCLIYGTNCDTLYIKEKSKTTLICPFRSITHKVQWRGPEFLTAYSDGIYLKNTLSNHEKLRITGNYSIGEYNLEINNFSPEEEGHYRCDNINGSTAVHASFYLEVYRSPSNMSVTNTSTNGLLEVNEGQIILLKCTVESGNPSENMMWVHNDSILVFGGPKLLVYEFVAVVTDHSKIYMCIANNSKTEDSVKFQVQLYVKELPYVDIRNVSATVLEVAKGGDIVLDCDYKTNTKPYKLTWIFKNESLITESADGIPLNGALHISSIRTNNTGTYKCYVYNRVGIGSAMVDVLVTYKPELKSNDSLLFDTEVGRPAFISIAIRSFEKPTASWTSSAGGILGLLNVKEEQNDMFSIKGTIVPSTDHHFGKYGIRIRNRIGSLHTEIVLTYTDIRVLTSPGKYSCSIGASTTINCFVNTNLYRKWSCVWQHFYNQEFIRSLPCTVKDGISLLPFEFCNNMDTGIYRCVLETQTWNFSSDAELSVKGPPIILTSITKKHSNNIVLSTFFVSDPPANDIAWIFSIGKTEKQIVSNSAIFNVLSSNSSADISVYGKTITINCIRTDLKLVDPKSVKEGWFLCLISNILGSSETVFNTTYKYTTESHTDTILYSSMFPMKSSEAPFAVKDGAKDNYMVIFLIVGLTLFVVLTLAGAIWQYKASLKGTIPIQIETELSSGTALQNIRQSTSSDDIYEEISNENSDACQDIAEQEPEEEVDLVHSSIAEESISATDTNVYEDLNEVPKEINPTNSEHYKTIRSEMPVLDHNSDDESYLIPGPAYLIVIDSDQEKEAKPYETTAS